MRRTLIDRYGNARGRHARLLGNIDLEHSIDIARLNSANLCIRQSEPTQECASGPLKVLEAVAVNVRRG